MDTDHDQERTFVLLDIQHLLRARRDEETDDGGEAA
jgi:hypothetical protein